MALKRFMRVQRAVKTASFEVAHSISAPGQQRLSAHSADSLYVAIAHSDAAPDTAEFERDLQTFKDLCALTDTTT